MWKLPKIRHAIADIPLIGRYIYPFLNSRSIFHERGKFYSRAYEKNPSLKRSNAKVAVIGLPKSGNVWLSSLIGDALDLKVVNPYSDYFKKGVMMLHDPFKKPWVYRRRDLVAGIYIMRDVRDIICSFYHYSKTEDYRKYVDPTCYFENISDFYYQYFLAKAIHIYDWDNHAREYIEHGMGLVKYEDLWEDSEAALTRVFNCMNIPVSEEAIKQAVENNTLAKKKKEGTQLWRKMPTTHFRKGGSGNYVNEMPEELIEAVNERFGDYLKRWGYKV